MDAKVQWQVNSDVNTLVDSITKCKQELVTSCFCKHGMSSKLVKCDVFASDKMLELLQLSELWTPCIEMTEEDVTVPLNRRQKKTTMLVADFGSFKLHRMKILKEARLRVVVTMQAEAESAEQLWFGDVEIEK